MGEIAEKWKDIKGYEGLYQVSNKGKVYSTYKKENKIIQKYKNNYLFTTLYKEGKGKVFLIHRLVAEAFIPNQDNKPTVNHKNHVRTDNRVENLEWATRLEQIDEITKQKMSIKAKLRKYSEEYKSFLRDLHAKKVKNICQYTLDGNFIKEWNSLREIERVLGFGHSNISACCKGKKNQAYNYIWKYKNEQPD